MEITCVTHQITYVVLQGETLNLCDSWPMRLQYTTLCIWWGVMGFSLWGARGHSLVPH